MRPTKPLSIEQVGERLDLSIRQGSTFGPIRHTLTNPDNTPVDFTGSTVRGKVRKSALEPGAPLAEIVVIFPGDRTLGYYDFSIPAASTQALPLTKDFETFYWDMEWVDSLGRVIPLFFGDFVVQAEATRDDTIAPTPEETC